MRCPVCLDTELVEHIRDGIEVDHCPRCRGIWLDRGELEKLLDLAEARTPGPRATSSEPHRPPPVLPRDQRDPGEEPWDDREAWDERRPRKRKRRGGLAELLEDVFEAFD